MKSEEKIRKHYNEIAEDYDSIEGVAEWVIMGRLRKKLLSEARGNVLEVAIGTGRSLKYYPRSSRITGVDLSKGMLSLASKRARKLRREVRLKIGDAQKLSFKNKSFDNVIDNLALCTYPDPVKALKEMKRVCKDEGKILLLEHGISNNRAVERIQKRMAKRHYENHACHLMRDPLALVKEAGLKIVRQKRGFFGTLYLIEARP